MGSTPRELTTQQRRFVDAYTGDCLGNGAASARAAGYSEHSARRTAVDLLKLPHVAQAIEERLSVHALSAVEVLHRLGQQARNEWTEFLGTDGAVDLEKLEAAGLKHLVKGTKWDKDGRLVVEFHDAQTALVQIGRYHKLFTDRAEVVGDPDQPVTVAIVRGVSYDDL